MSSSALIIAEMLITLGVCVGFGVHQLWDLKRANAKAAAEAAKAAQQRASGARADQIA